MVCTVNQAVVKSVALKPEGIGFDHDRGRIDIRLLSQIKSLATCLRDHIKLKALDVVTVLVTTTAGGYVRAVGSFDLDRYGNRTLVIESVLFVRLCVRDRRISSERCDLLQSTHDVCCGVTDPNGDVITNSLSPLLLDICDSGNCPVPSALGSKAQGNFHCGVLEQTLMASPKNILFMAFTVYKTSPLFFEKVNQRSQWNPYLGIGLFQFEPVFYVHSFSAVVMMSSFHRFAGHAFRLFPFGPLHLAACNAHRSSLYPATWPARRHFNIKL
ncbi:hypothetical protein EVAR_36953_1 [Eumeta japonica]|uniref:Uncharacterized protein n=1 Tax=Eumeta variegata TaxID=151549 RepID=A0A4C1W893_EUMVA|nr:hypothetical protein EVAR_36953_1 [Eumeta japonica]